MKILHYLQLVRADVGGPARAVLDLCTALSSRGHEVTLLANVDADVPAAWKAAEPGMPRSVLIPMEPAPMSAFSAPELARVDELIRSADAVHLHGVWERANLQVAARARALRRPYFISVRGMLDDWCMDQGALKKRIYLALAGRKYLESAARVHLTAQFEYEQAKKRFPRGNGIVIPNLLDLSAFRDLPGPETARARFPELTNGAPNLLFLSRIHVKKGIEHLLHAARLLKDKGRRVNVLIAGPGDAAYVETLRRLALELSIEDRTTFLGLVVNREKLSLYQAADLFVLPTSQENFGFVFPEALACGLPVITTKGVDIWPELESSGAARITPADPPDLAAAIERMLDLGPGLKDLGARGREWVHGWLDTAKVLRRFEQMYEHGIKGS